MYQLYLPGGGHLRQRNFMDDFLGAMHARVRAGMAPSLSGWKSGQGDTPRNLLTDAIE